MPLDRTKVKVKIPLRGTLVHLRGHLRQNAYDRGTVAPPRVKPERRDAPSMEFAMEDDRCIGFTELQTYVPYSRAHIHRMEKDPEYHHGDPFPARVRLGNCRVCWWVSEVLAWLRRRPRG